MPSPDTLSLIISLIAGLLLGLFFFGGLWWTIRKSLGSRQPALWFIGSLLLRTTLVVAGFYFIGGEQWPRLLSGLFGFIMARLLVTRLTRPAPEAAKEINHAP